MWCVLVDLSLVLEWQNNLPHSAKSVMGHLGMKTIDIKTRDLGSFLGFDINSQGTLGGRKQNHTLASSKVRGIETGKFPLYAYLPDTQVRALRKVLRRRGAKLNISV